ncbi:hypothetical protein [Rhizobium rhizogenes]|uniref:hypothetical protein n=1 Tax=Rhizobium rhizogenes TaxID=359 RepID=UPI0022C0868A|nr:hypothetical protein [Rhizobium rhizogenes]MCZ7485779.1 hypothetical protein [Rhizobium rhizogenes]
MKRIFNHKILCEVPVENGESKSFQKNQSLGGEISSLCGAGFRSGKPKTSISGVRHKGDTAVFPCFSAVGKKAFSHKKAAPGGTAFQGCF